MIVASFAAFTLAMAAMLSLGISASSAAITGTITAPSIVTMYDGANVPNSLDSSANNNVVASNDSVAFEWNITANALSDGTVSQTLPPGWTWQTSSSGFAALNTTNSAYSSTYLIVTNPDGSTTLTATISSPGSVGISVQGLVAIPDGSVANGTMYTPTLTATDSNGPQTETAPAIEVVNQTRSDVTIAGGGTATSTTNDFGDGNGVVPAYETSYTIGVAAPNTGMPLIGAANTTLALPISIVDNFGPLPSGITTTDLVLDPTTTLPAGDSAALVCSGTSCTITLSGSTPLNLANGPFDVTVHEFVPTSQIPAQSAGAPAVIANTVSAGSGFDDTVPDASTGNDLSSGSYQSEPQNYGGTNQIYGVYAANNPSSPVYGVDPNGNSNYTNVSSGNVAEGSVVMDDFGLHGPNSSPTTYPGLTNPVAYDFWNPSEQTIIDNQGYYVGGWNDPAYQVPSSDYSIAYTTFPGAVTSAAVAADPGLQRRGHRPRPPIPRPSPASRSPIRAMVATSTTEATDCRASTRQTSRSMWSVPPARSMPPAPPGRRLKSLSLTTAARCTSPPSCSVSKRPPTPPPLVRAAPSPTP